MKTTERPLNTEELDEIARFSSEGISALGVDADDQPKSIITAIDLYVDKQRLNIQLASEDDYASLILSMAYLWGDQVCRAHGWKWVILPNSSVPANAKQDIQSKQAESATFRWLDGVWEGEGYQSDTRTT